MQYLNDVWVSICDEFLNEIGLSPEAENILDSRVRMAKMQAEYVITGQKHLKTHIEFERKRLNLVPQSGKNNLQSTLSQLSKYYGFKLDARSTTVVEYYSYLKNAVDGR